MTEMTEIILKEVVGMAKVSSAGTTRSLISTSQALQGSPTVRSGRRFWNPLARMCRGPS